MANITGQKFHTVDYLKQGTPKQILAYKAITELNVMENLSEYQPILCGTLPIGIDVTGSDLDIILEVTDFQEFEEKVKAYISIKKNLFSKGLSSEACPL